MQVCLEALLAHESSVSPRSGPGSDSDQNVVCSESLARLKTVCLHPPQPSSPTGSSAAGFSDRRDKAKCSTIAAARSDAGTLCCCLLPRKLSAIRAFRPCCALTRWQQPRQRPRSHPIICFADARLPSPGPRRPSPAQVLGPLPAVATRSTGAGIGPGCTSPGSCHTPSETRARALPDQPETQRATSHLRSAGRLPSRSPGSEYRPVRARRSQQTPLASNDRRCRHPLLGGVAPLAAAGRGWLLVEACRISESPSSGRAWNKVTGPAECVGLSCVGVASFHGRASIPRRFPPLALCTRRR